MQRVMQTIRKYLVLAGLNTFHLDHQSHMIERTRLAHISRHDDAVASFQFGTSVDGIRPRITYLIPSS